MLVNKKGNYKECSNYHTVAKIIADVDCSQEIKRHLLLGRKAMTNLDSMPPIKINKFKLKIK